jgi:hypothetical protein
MASAVLNGRGAVKKDAPRTEVWVRAWCGHFRASGRGWLLSAVLSGFLYVASLARTKAENRADYRFEDYAEENGRIHVQTQGLYFDTALNSWISLKGNAIYDAISGATPTGAPFLPGTNAVTIVPMHDKRYAGFLEPTLKFGNQTLSGQFSYSQESDYRSIGAALNEAIDFNEKNTTLLLGISHSFDHILPNEGELYQRTGSPITRPLRKDDADALLGLTQLLGPATLVSANLTLGYSYGFLNDPYKRVMFDNSPYNPGPDPANPFPFTVWPESRPGHKFRQVAFFSVQHYFDAANGAMEVTYRFHHDDFGITAHTVSLEWNQKLGKRVILSPLFRFHTQRAAFFYNTHFPGDPGNPASPIPLPSYYSADYRLSALDSFTYGLSLSVSVHEHASLELAYKRYEILGNDSITPSFQYPKANTLTGGLTAWF